jgi:hypothetical protein
MLVWIFCRCRRLKKSFPLQNQKSQYWNYSLFDYPKVVIKNKGNGQGLLARQICSKLSHILQQDMRLATDCAANFLKFVDKVAKKYWTN